MILWSRVQTQKFSRQQFWSTWDERLLLNKNQSYSDFLLLICFVFMISLLSFLVYCKPWRHLCRRKAHERKSASSTNSSEKSVPVHVDEKAKNSVRIRVSVHSASSVNTVATEKSSCDEHSGSDRESHVSNNSQSVRSLPEFIPNYSEKLNGIFKFGKS